MLKGNLISHNDGTSRELVFRETPQFYISLTGSKYRKSDGMRAGYPPLKLQLDLSTIKEIEND